MIGIKIKIKYTPDCYLFNKICREQIMDSNLKFATNKSIS